jgi:biofilm protein TabA
MIIDRLENWQLYPLGPAWEKAIAFLTSLKPDRDEGEYPLQNEEIFARIMSYNTRSVEGALPEAHRKYIDVQVVLTGAEIVECFPTDGLVVADPYDTSKDVEFFNRTTPAPVRIELRPGIFAVFFPQDAHIPCLSVSTAPELVKKVVVKIKA